MLGFLTSFRLSAGLDCARCLSEEPSIQFYSFFLFVLVSGRTVTTVFSSTVKVVFCGGAGGLRDFSASRQFQFRFASKGSIVNSQS